MEFAVADYQQAEELDPEDWTIWTRLAVVHNTLGLCDHEARKYQEAADKFSVAIKYNPCVSQYYENRGKTRLKMSDERGAREDTIISHLLDPSDEQVLALLLSLFPGCSMADILSSEPAAIAKIRLDRSTQPSRQTGVETSAPRFEGNATKHKTEQEAHMDTVRPCVAQSDVYQETVSSKKKVNKALKEALHQRGSLRHTGPRLAAVMPAQSGGPMPGDKERPYHWRKFCEGVGRP
ncbi:TTC16 protein, partial [Amia calva]|nr:TTC16 protein [Amia calva]